MSAATAIDSLAQSAFGTYDNALALLELVAQHENSLLLLAARSLMRNGDQSFMAAVESDDEQALEVASGELEVVVGVLEAAALAAAGKDDGSESRIWGVYLLAKMSEDELDRHIAAMR